MERRLPDANDGKRCVSVAVGGKVGILMCALCVDSIIALLGKRTWIPSATRCTLDRIDVEDLVKKCTPEFSRGLTKDSVTSPFAAVIGSIVLVVFSLTFAGGA